MWSTVRQVRCRAREVSEDLDDGDELSEICSFSQDDDGDDDDDLYIIDQINTYLDETKGKLVPVEHFLDLEFMMPVMKA